MIQSSVHILTEDEAGALARQLMAELSAGTWLFLEGDLGAGKTTFVGQMMVMSSNEEDIATQSPTFAVVQSYAPPAEIAHRFENIIHMDLYRIRGPQELLYMGLDVLVTPQSLVVVEWPSRLSPEEWAAFWRDSGLDVPSVVCKLSIEHIPAQPEKRRYALEISRASLS